MKKIICLEMLILAFLVSFGLNLRAEKVLTVKTPNVEQLKVKRTDFSTKRQIDTTNENVTKSQSGNVSFKRLFELLLLSFFCILLSVYILGTLAVIVFQPDSYGNTFFCGCLSAIIGSVTGTYLVVLNFGNEAGFIFALLCFCWALFIVNGWCPDR